ncbi:MAG: hypothetical protein ACKORE_10615 [Bacteroidota bacterium]
MRAASTLSLVFGSVLMMLMSSCADEDFQDPNADPREKFLGASWLCKETIGSAAPQTFTIFFTSYGISDTVRISNFSGYGNTAVAYALVSGNSLQIPQQQIGVTNIPVQGSGTFSSQGGNERIDLTYLTDGNNATALCTR